MDITIYILYTSSDSNPSEYSHVQLWQPRCLMVQVIDWEGYQPVDVD